MSSTQFSNSTTIVPAGNTRLTPEQAAFAHVLGRNLVSLWKQQQDQLAPEKPLAPPSRDADADGPDSDFPPPDDSIKEVDRA
jgi:hypothetical protein